MNKTFEVIAQVQDEPALGDTIQYPEPDTAHAFRSFRTAFANQQLTNLAQAVYLSQDVGGLHQVVLCGVDEENASSQICLALGRILAQCSGKPICLVDANKRTSRLSQLLNKDRLAAVPASSREQVAKVEKGLWFTSMAGHDFSPADSAATPDQIKKCLDHLRDSFAFVLIDAPGVNTRGDAAILGQLSNGVILVIEANSTRKASALRAKKTLLDMNIRLLGCVLNNRTFPIPERLYRRL